ncbi:hypothetical protein [Okeania sp. SIO2B3]|uniref:hypothetical protein n=1 Tax=Okeania sp. SIO2B3 TaxID=2607784 RepID=UPI0013C02AC1|nr:hypothetical protein [Okeania sp. SIO2B3]NET42250.1 hypothetical protein [Okeania sp. SIO2B3]
MKSVLTNFIPNFKSRQIVCLEYENTCLYAEVIQVLEARKMCWVRPLLLKLSTSEVGCENHQNNLEKSSLWDLRDGADLVWPICLFREAIDTEFMPLLTELEFLDSQEKNLQVSHQKLQHFVRKVWQAFPDVFPLIPD